ncbi:unnamed protein product [Sphagnum jensenii]
MSLAIANASAVSPSARSRGWLHEVSGLTGGVLSSPLLQTATKYSNSTIVLSRQQFLSWLLIGDGGDSGAQVAEENYQYRRLFPMIAKLVGSQTPVSSVLSTHLLMLESSLALKPFEANRKLEMLRSSNREVEEAHHDLIDLFQDYASICAREVAEGVINSQRAWEEDNYMGSGHIMAEAILAYTCAEAFLAAVRFWSGKCADSSYVQIYAQAYQSGLAADGFDQQSLARVLEAHEGALTLVRTAARRQAAEKMEALLKE